MWWDGMGLTVNDVLRGNGLLVRLVAYFIGLGRDKVNELRATVDHQLAGVVCHPHIRQRFFDHLVNRRSRDGQVVIVSRG